MTTIGVSGWVNVFFWYQLTRVVPDKIQRAIKLLFVYVRVCVLLEPFYGLLDFGKTNLDLLEQEMVTSNGISWAICKSASRFRQITMPTSHHSVFLQAGCPYCRPINSVKALEARFK